MGDEFREFHRKALWTYRNDDLKSAQYMVEDFLSEHVPDFHAGKKYHYFNSSLEKFLFDELTGEKDYISVEDNYGMIFSLYSNILLNLNQFSKAKVYAQLNIDLNPLDISSYISLSKIFALEYAQQMVESTLKDALRFVHDEYDIFDVYQELSKYYAQINENEISEVLFKIAKTKNCSDYKKDYLIKLFDEYDIQLGYNQKLLDAYCQATTKAHFLSSFGDEYILFYDYAELIEFNQYFED